MPRPRRRPEDAPPEPQTPVRAAESERLHLAALARRRELVDRIVGVTGNDPRALLAELARSRVELRGLTPGEAAALGGAVYRRALRLYGAGG